MIRVLLIPSSDYIGHPFPQRHNQIFERLHDGNRFEVHVVRFRLFEHQKLNSNLYIHELRGTPESGAPAYYLTNMLAHAAQIMKIVRDEGVHLVVLSNLAAPFAYLLLERLAHRRVPSIFDLPDYYPTSATGYISNLHSTSGSILTAAFDLMLRHMMLRTNAVTAASDNLVRYAKTHGAKNAFYVPNGIPEEFLQIQDGRAFRNDAGFTESDFIVGYLGSLDFWLDLRPLIRAMRIARKNGLNLKGLIVGRGLHNQSYSKKVTNWIAEEGLVEDVIRMDFIPHQDVPKFAASLDVGTIPFDVRNPTAYYSAPTKMWEYFSQMKPVVATPIPEALRNSDSVLIASEAVDYLRHFSTVLSRGDEIRRRVRIGYETARRHTWKTAAEKFAHVCTTVLDKSHTCSR